MDYGQESLKLHEEKKGKYEIKSKVDVNNVHDLSVVYTPGVAEPCRKIAANLDDAYKYTSKANTIAVVTDGSAVLGLGNIGALAGLPVMEGKAILFKQFGGVDAIPICLATQDTDEIIETIVNIAPAFGGINLEDISAPRCFEIERALQEKLDIPIFHDDQHGTAIVVLAGLINSLKLVEKNVEDLKIVMSGAGAAGIAIAKLLMAYGAKDIIMLDSKGAIYEGREGLNPEKEEIAKVTNPEKYAGGLDGAIKDADMFIGISMAGLLSKEMVATMNAKAMVFAMANPDPEIMPDLAKEAGAYIVATGRSDFPNQINNVLAFPGVFRGLLDCRAPKVTTDMMIAASTAIAGLIKEPAPDKIIPGPFDPGTAEAVAKAIIECA